MFIIVLAFFAKTYLASGGKKEIALVVNDNPQYVDVRTVSEFRDGHNSKSINIPLDQLSKDMQKLDKNRPIVVVCASGVRSAQAKKILVEAGFKNTVNGGSWKNISAD